MSSQTHSKRAGVGVNTMRCVSVCLCYHNDHLLAGVNTMNESWHYSVSEC